MKYFKNFISNELLDKICEQSNIYALQKREQIAPVAPKRT